MLSGTQPGVASQTAGSPSATPRLRALNWLSLVCVALFSARIPVTSQYMRRLPSSNSPSKPPDTYQVFTSWLKMRGPASIGLREKNCVLLLSRVMPNGLYSWSASQTTFTMYGVEPLSGPQKSGTGAARPCDLRLLKLASARNVIVSVTSYSALPKMFTRSFGVTRWLNGW